MFALILSEERIAAKNMEFMAPGFLCSFALTIPRVPVAPGQQSPTERRRQLVEKTYKKR